MRKEGAPCETSPLSTCPGCLHSAPETETRIPGIGGLRGCQGSNGSGYEDVMWGREEQSIPCSGKTSRDRGEEERTDGGSQNIRGRWSGCGDCQLLVNYLQGMLEEGRRASVTHPAKSSSRCVCSSATRGLLKGRCRQPRITQAGRLRRRHRASVRRQKTIARAWPQNHYTSTIYHIPPPRPQNHYTSTIYHIPPPSLQNHHLYYLPYPPTKPTDPPPLLLPYPPTKPTEPTPLLLPYPPPPRGVGEKLDNKEV